MWRCVWGNTWTEAMEFCGFLSIVIAQELQQDLDLCTTGCEKYIMCGHVLLRTGCLFVMRRCSLATEVEGIQTENGYV